MVMIGGARAVARCDILGVSPYSDTDNGLFRGYLSAAYRKSQDALAGWMAEAGMTVRRDAAGNLVGRYEGTHPGAPLIIGSHLDSVRDAGRYDGPLGILLGVECVAALHARQLRMPFAIEVYAFGDEEGSRFPTAMLTSRAVAGTLDAAPLDAADDQGMTLSDALAGFSLSAETFASARHPGAIAYIEAHIEQGPVLEAADLAVGTVTAIAAQLRYVVTVRGRAGHAGTNAMHLRRDALTASAEMFLAVERVARNGDADLVVATVGLVEVVSGAANVVPGVVRFTLDVRAGTVVDRDQAAGQILAAFTAIAARRDVRWASEVLQDLPATPSDPRLIALMDVAVLDAGQQPMRLVSGAGHDAMVMASLCPTVMLFVRCAGGISHNPAEKVSTADSDVAFRVLQGVIEKLGEDYRA